MCVLLFVAWTAEADSDVILYYGLWRSPFQLLGPLFESLPLIRQPLWHLLLVCAAPVCLLHNDAWRARARPMDAAIIAGLGTLALGFVWGLARGGSAYQAYYQLKALVITLVAAGLLRAAIRSPHDLKALGKTILAAALVRGTLAIYFFYAHVRGRVFWPYPRWMTTHDDSVLFVAGILVVVAWALARLHWRAWLAAVLVSGHLLLAIKVNNRRLAWIEILAAVAFGYLLLPQARLRRWVTRWMLLAAPVLAVYVAVGWGRSESIFAPLHALDSVTGEDEDASARARNEENLNLVFTFLQHPLMGSGWGHPYQEVSSVYTHFGPEFWQYRYLPHNSLVGLVAFSGFVGLLGVWSVLVVAAFLAARGCRAARAPTERAAAMAAFCVLPVYALQCYGDMGLQSLSGGLLLAVAIAVAGRVPAWTGAWPGAAATSGRQGRGARVGVGGSESTRLHALRP
jgi:O-antigen ligase